MNKVMDEQGDIRAGGGCVDQVFVVRLGQEGILDVVRRNVGCCRLNSSCS